MKRVRLTPSAEADLNDIIAHLWRQSPDAAEQVFDAFADAFHRIAHNPGIGHYRADLTDEPLQFYAVFSWLIIYRAGTNPPEVVRSCTVPVIFKKNWLKNPDQRSSR